MLKVKNLSFHTIVYKICLEIILYKNTISDTKGRGASLILFLSLLKQLLFNYIFFFLFGRKEYKDAHYINLEQQIHFPKST